MMDKARHPYHAGRMNSRKKAQRTQERDGLGGKMTAPQHRCRRVAEHPQQHRNTVLACLTPYAAAELDALLPTIFDRAVKGQL
jgi:hypothetical protein